MKNIGNRRDVHFRKIKMQDLDKEFQHLIDNLIAAKSLIENAKVVAKNIQEESKNDDDLDKLYRSYKNIRDELDESMYDFHYCIMQKWNSSNCF